MTIKDLENKAKEIWGNEKLPLAQIIVRLGKIYGDICRYERGSIKDKGSHTDEELKKEFGNLIFSSVKYAKELGYSAEECVEIAIKAQENYPKK